MMAPLAFNELILNELLIILLLLGYLFIFQRPLVGNFMINDERDGLVNQKYRRTLQAFNVSVSSTTDSSEDGKRRARAKMRGSDTTGIAALTKFYHRNLNIHKGLDMFHKIVGLFCNLSSLASRLFLYEMKFSLRMLKCIIFHS